MKVVEVGWTFLQGFQSGWKGGKEEFKFVKEKKKKKKKKKKQQQKNETFLCLKKTNFGIFKTENSRMNLSEMAEKRKQSIFRFIIKSHFLVLSNIHPQ